MYETPATAAAPVKKTAAEYAGMPWRDVLSKGAEEFLPSAGRAIKAIPAAIMHPSETAGAFKKAGLGAAGKMGLYEEKDPRARAEQEAMFGAMVEPVTATYHAARGDTGELKKLIAEDPFAVASLAGAPIGGGIGAVGRGLGAAGTLGKIAGAPLRAAGAVTSAVSDPLGALGGLGKGAVGAGAEAMRKFRRLETGVEDYPFEMAYKAGALPSGAAPKEAFNAFATGSGDIQDFAQKAKDAAKSLRDKEISDWAKSKGVMAGSFTQPLPYDLVHSAINEYRSTRLPPRQFGMSSANAAHDALENIERNLLKRQLPQNAKNPVNTLAGFDQLKQELWDASERAGTNMEKNAILSAYHGVKDTLNRAAPDYQELMDRWRATNANISNIEKSLGTTDKVAANAALARFVKQQKTPEGRDLIAQLSEHEPELPYMAAGAALRDASARGHSGIGQAIMMSQYIPYIFRGVTEGKLGDVAQGLGMAGAQAALQSPSLARNISYTAGQLSRTPPVRAVSTAKNVVEGAWPYAYPAAYQEERARREVEPLFNEKNPIEVSRATGGRINRGMSAQMLIAAVERDKADGQKATESILEQPDEHVVQALKVANANI
ncbi:MAG: hypothetical protein ACR2HL_09150 [Methylocystis sp.]